MAIRSRLKALAKKMIFGSSSTSSPTPPTPPVKSSPSFQQTPVKTEAAMDPPKTTEKTTTPTTNDAVSPSEELNVETPVEESQAASETSNLDPNEASYVFDIVDLFPEACPHCGASSTNNWIRIENKFACGSCEAPYAD